MKSFMKYCSIVMLLFLFGCGGGSGGDANFTMSLSSSTVVAGGSVVATSQLVSASSSPVNNIGVTYTSNRPDLIHFASNTATNTGASTITTETNDTGSAYVVLNIDNSVAIPAGGVSVSITATSLGIPSTQQLTVTPLLTGGGTTGSDTGTANVKLALVTTPTTVDANGGQVIATATLVDSTGAAIVGKTVKFSIVAGPASFTSSPSVDTTTSGTATVNIQTTATNSTQNVLVQAATTYNSTTYTQQATFQITKGIGTLVVTAPATTSSTGKAPAIVSWITAIPVQLLDANGHPRTDIPITLSVLTSDRVGYLVSTGPGTYATTATINTDAQGKAIFSIQTANLAVASVGGLDTSQVVWKAQTNDTSPVIGYASSTYSLTGN